MKQDKRNGLTFDEWLASANVPEGFNQWSRKYEHWNLGDGIGWAIACFEHRGKPSKQYPWLF